MKPFTAIAMLLPFVAIGVSDVMLANHTNALQKAADTYAGEIRQLESKLLEVQQLNSKQSDEDSELVSLHAQLASLRAQLASASSQDKKLTQEVTVTGGYCVADDNIDGEIAVTQDDGSTYSPTYAYWVQSITAPVLNHGVYQCNSGTFVPFAATTNP